MSKAIGTHLLEEFVPLKGKIAQTEGHYLQGKAWLNLRVLMALESFLWSLSLPRERSGMGV